jgi:hypothetical protein
LGIGAAFFFEGFEEAELLGVGAVAFRDGDVAAVFEKRVAHAALVAELAALRFPDGGDGEFLVETVHADGGIVGGFEDSHLAPIAIGEAPEGHADAVAAVGDEAHRRDARVVDGIGNPLVHRDDEVVAFFAGEGLGKHEGRRQRALGGEGDGELGSVGVELETGGDVEAGGGVVEGEIEAVGRRRSRS